MLEHVGTSTRSKPGADLGRDALVEVGLEEGTRALADPVELVDVDADDVVAHVPEALGQQAARAAQVEDLARRRRLVSRVEIRPCELSSLGLSSYSSLRAIRLPSPNPAFCSR